MKSKLLSQTVAPALFPAAFTEMELRDCLRLRSFRQTLFLTVEGFSNTTEPIAVDGVSTNAPAHSFARIDLSGVMAPGMLCLILPVPANFSTERSTKSCSTTTPFSPPKFLRWLPA